MITHTLATKIPKNIKNHAYSSPIIIDVMIREKEDTELKILTM